MTDTQRTPIDHSAERALLGSMLLRADTIPDALDLVTPRDYTLPRHATYHEGIAALHEAGDDVNPATLVAWLDHNGHLGELGGFKAASAELVALLAEPSHSATTAHAEIVARHAARRRLTTTLAAAQQATRDGNETEARRLAAEAAQDTGPVTWLPWDDVAAVIRGDIDPITPTLLRRTDGQALMYPGLTHWLMGEPGKGKSWVALHATAEQLNDGHAVIYLDWEGNRRIIGDRLRNLGVTADTVDGGLLYWRPPTLTTQLRRALVRAADTTDTTLVVIDGVAKALAAQGYSEDKAPDVLAWLTELVNPLADTGAAVLLLDHVVKEKEGRGLWARGSGAKLGEVSGAAWTVKAREGFSRSRAGHVDLVQAKDREGCVGTDGDTVARIRFAPHHGGLTITVEPPRDAAAGPDGQFRPTGLMEAISAAVEKLNSAGIKPTWNELDRQVPGKRQWKASALSALLEEGHLVIETGPRNARHHTLGPAGAYRQAEDRRSDKYQPTDGNDPVYDPDDTSTHPF